MNWARVYNQLMIRAIPRGLNKRNLGYYVERHHVIPKSMGGSDSADNFVLLTGREHLLAHRLLCKMYPESSSLFFALYQMTIDQRDRGYTISSRLYEKAKIKFASNQLGDLNPARRPEVREKMSLTRKGKPSAFKGKKHSAEALKKISESRIGVYCGEKNPMYGTRPWDTGSAKHSEAAQTVWGNAERAYQLFLTGCGHKKIFKELNIAGTNPSSFISVVKKFREGWIPMEDEEWVDRFQGWTLEINPFKDIS